MWHCSLSLRADEGRLPDEKWARIATEFMDTMGFTEESGRSAARWVALHHGLSRDGNDHIHIAASLVREDGTKVDTYRDWPRTQDACRELERRHGLLVVVGRDDGRGRDRSTQRGELFTAARAADVPQGGVKQATRDGVIEPASARLERIVRACSTAAATEADFVHAVRREGVLIRPRYGAGDTSDVIGYSVALQPPPGTSGSAQTPHKTIWYGGGKLAKDLTLPRLRRCWRRRSRQRIRHPQRLAHRATPGARPRA